MKSSRRKFLNTGIGAAASMSIGSEEVYAQNIPPEEILVLTNGRIHTMNATDTVASSVAIRNGRFVALNVTAPRGARVINLGGRTVVPGLVEPHIHIVSLGNRPGYHAILENTTSIREVQQVLAARRKETPEGAWIT